MSDDTAPAPPAPPASLVTEEAIRFWNETVADYALDPHHLLLLEGCCATMDRLAEAKAAVDEHGPLVVDRFGQLKPNPGVIIERQLRESFARQLRQLDLDGEPDPQYRR